MQNNRNISKHWILTLGYLLGLQNTKIQKKYTHSHNNLGYRHIVNTNTQDTDNISLFLN